MVTRRQATAEDIDSRRIATLIRNGLLEEVHPTVLRVVGAPVTWRQRLAIATLAFDGAASHRAAGRLHGLDGFGRSSLVEITVPQRRQRHRHDIVVHRSLPWTADDLTMVDGIIVTTIARTLCDLGAVSTDDQVERALDDALRRDVSIRWILRTLDRIDRPGPSGTATLRRVLALPDRVGVVPDSYRERVTERILAHPELQPLVRQYEILNAGGKVLARPDLAIVDAKFGIEFHSDQWHYGPRRGRGDRRRDFKLAQVGWDLVYLDAGDHRSPDEAIAALVDVVRARRRRAS